jgi:hypothetical protein
MDTDFSPDDLDSWMDFDDAAFLLGMSPTHLQRLCGNGRFTLSDDGTKIDAAEVGYVAEQQAANHLALVLGANSTEQRRRAHAFQRAFGDAAAVPTRYKTVIIYGFGRDETQHHGLSRLAALLGMERNGKGYLNGQMYVGGHRDVFVLTTNDYGDTRLVVTQHSGTLKESVRITEDVQRAVVSASDDLDIAWASHLRSPIDAHAAATLAREDGSR